MKGYRRSWRAIDGHGGYKSYSQPVFSLPFHAIPFPAPPRYQDWSVTREEVREPDRISLTINAAPRFINQVTRFIFQNTVTMIIQSIRYQILPLNRELKP